MELNKVTKASQMNDAAVAAFDTFNARKRFRSNTNLVRFHRELEEKYGKPIQEKQLEDMFKALEQAGMGSLIVSRNKNNTRFAWNYSLRDVAKASKGGVKPEELQKVVIKAKPKIIRRGRAKAPEAPITASEPAEAPKVQEVLDVLVIRHGVVQTLQLSPEKGQLFDDMIKLFSK